MPDAEPQDILTPITEDAIFLTACVDPGGEAQGARVTRGFCDPVHGAYERNRPVVGHDRSPEPPLVA